MNDPISSFWFCLAVRAMNYCVPIKEERCILTVESLPWQGEDGRWCEKRESGKDGAKIMFIVYGHGTWKTVRPRNPGPTQDK